MSNKIRSLFLKGEKPKIEILRAGLDEISAFEIERDFIKQFGRIPNGPLLNLTDGGEGMSGHVLSKESRDKIKEKRKFQIFSPRTEEQCLNSSAGMKGKRNAKGAVRGWRKRIASFRPDGTLIKEYDFIRQVEEDGFSRSRIRKCLNGEATLAYGKIWSYT